MENKNQTALKFTTLSELCVPARARYACLNDGPDAPGPWQGQIPSFWEARTTHGATSAASRLNWPTLSRSALLLAWLIALVTLGLQIQGKAKQGDGLMEEYRLEKSLAGRSEKGAAAKWESGPANRSWQ